MIIFRVGFGELFLITTSVKKAEHRRINAFEPWCPLDFKEMQPVHPKGNQSWVFIGRTDPEAETLILWPPDVTS